MIERLGSYIAKGDEKRARKQMDFEGDRQYNQLENTRVGVVDPNLRAFQTYYSDAANRQAGDYAGMMDRFNNQIMPGFQNFAQTGGYGPQDLASIRSRALSPTRAVYANALRNVNRQRTLQGGYSPGYGTLMARMAREQGQGISDAATNAEAAIAQMVQQGKLAGLQGMTGAANAQTGLYGATPGAVNTFGNQVLGGAGQYLDLMNAFNTRLGHQYGTMGNIMQDPGTSGRVMGNIATGAQIGRSIGEGISGIGAK